MATIVKSFKRGAWKAHIVYCYGQYGIIKRVRLDYPNGYNTEWPVQYDDGTIAYDGPDMPRDAQRAAKAAFKVLNS